MWKMHRHKYTFGMHTFCAHLTLTDMFFVANNPNEEFVDSNIFQPIGDIRNDNNVKYFISIDHCFIID